MGVGRLRESVRKLPGFAVKLVPGEGKKKRSRRSEREKGGREYSVCVCLLARFFTVAIVFIIFLP